MAQTKIKAGLFEGVIGNGTDGYFLMSNGDGTMTWSSIVINPTIASIAYPGSVTAADPAGGETITVTGTGFKTGATVTIGGTAAPAVSYVSATQITFTTPAKAAGDYDIVVTNTDTGSATYINGISYNGIPTWTTAAGSLGTFASETTISTITLQATEPDAGTITFSITNGALPTGLSLTGANIDGTTTLETADTLYTFTVTATDDESQATPRTFTITVRKQFIGTENFTINTYTGNGSTQSIEGKIGTAADFNGSSSKIDFSSYQVPTTNVSFSFWFRSNNTPSSAATAEVLYNHFNGAQSYGVQIGSTTIGSYALGAGGSPDYLTYSMSADTLWHHVVVTMGSTNGHVLYIDGSPVATDAALTSYYGGGTGTNNIGSSGSSKWFDGQIDQFRIFEKELSSSEVTTLYGENNASLFKSTTDIFDDGSGVALYEFEEGAKDTGGTNGYIGAAGVFNGSSSKIVVSGFAQPTSDLSVSMWVKFNSISSAQKEFFDWVGNSSVPTIRLNTYTSNDLRFSMGGSRYISADSLSITTGVWYHIAFSIDRSANAATLYFNGSALGSTVTPSGSSSDTEGLFIGCNLDENRFSDCIIDQVRIFSKAISSSEVTTLYGETSASATKSTTDIFDDSSGIALYELEGNANDTGDTYNGTATNVSYAYDGTPTNVSFVGTSFQPDLVWVKRRDSGIGNTRHLIFDSIRGVGKRISSESADQEYTVTQEVISFDNNGFTLGSNGSANGSGGSLVAWCWKAGGTAVSNTDGTITSQVSANQDAGFSIVEYTKSGTSGTMGHGLTSTPELIIEKRTDGTAYWNVRIEGITANNQTIYLNQTTEVSTHPSLNLWTTPTTSVFGYDSANATAGDYIAYCFHSVDGYQRIGSYSGSGVAGKRVYTTDDGTSSGTGGFKPRFVMIKSTNIGNDYTSWVMHDSLRNIESTDRVTNPLYANRNYQEGLRGNGSSSSGVLDLTFNDDGFTIEVNDAERNANGYNYIYLAIA
jgi:hypothetical protein